MGCRHSLPCEVLKDADQASCEAHDIRALHQIVKNGVTRVPQVSLQSDVLKQVIQEKPRGSVRSPTPLLTLARTRHFATLDRNGGGGHPQLICPLIAKELPNKD